MKRQLKLQNPPTYASMQNSPAHFMLHVKHRRGEVGEKDGPLLT